ncbi:MAG: hypothetical protein U1F33_01040 [Alphaproteobacteria bacterium]
MAVIYVASSKALAEWGGDVGLTKHLYKVGIAEDGAEAAIAALNEARHAGVDDWRLLKQEEADGVDEREMWERLGRKEKPVDPLYYPKIQGAEGIFKVKITNVENHWVVKHALESSEVLAKKMKPADVAAYLISNALK